jgi:ADP-dependent NAD(P)H-hydrate dehydratase / NAD(P)H-hydrate epimerase
MRVQTKKEAVESDNNAMSSLGIPSQILMENAARSAAEIISEYIKPDSKICILCGSGNNGGDGFALARHLTAMDYENVYIYSIADKSKMSAETLLNYRMAQNLKIPLYEFSTIEQFNLLSKDFDCYIEALIGVGGSDNLRGMTIDLLEKINLSKGIKIAIDIPAGLNADTGMAHQNGFRADLTITMFAPKVGMYLHKGRELCGEIRVASLGIPTHHVELFSSAMIYNPSDIRKILKHRNNNSSKFDYGKVLIIAGSDSYPGAAALTANATVRAGAGLVYLASTEFHPALFPEVIRVNLKKNDDGTIHYDNKKILSEYISKSDSIAIGPGLNNNAQTISLMKELISENPDKKFVIDADGLKSVSGTVRLNPNIVLTPHIYEFSKLVNLPVDEIKLNFYEITKKFAESMNCIIHLKSVPAVTSNGKNQVLTCNGNAGMASGGSGDVLTGIIAALIAQGIDTFQAASLGAYLHALSGDKYIESNSQESLKASDLIENLKFVL